MRPGIYTQPFGDFSSSPRVLTPLLYINRAIADRSWPHTGPGTAGRAGWGCQGRHTDHALRLLQEQRCPLSSRLLPLKELFDVSDSAIQPLSQRRDVVTGVQNVRHPAFPLLLPQLVGVGWERRLSPLSSNLQCDPTDGQHPPHSQDDEV